MEKITATRIATCKAYMGQPLTATLLAASGSTKRNAGRGVYRWSSFAMAGDAPGAGWSLLEGEYRTKREAIRAAEKIEATVTIA